MTPTAPEQVILDVAGPQQHSAWEVDWRRLGRRAFIASSVVLAVVELYLQARGTEYGFDFRGSTWHAAKAVLGGQSPYPPADPTRLLHQGNDFVYPPPLALLAIPFSLVPFSTAIVVWNLVCSVALVAALRLLGVIDRRLLVLAVCSFPVVSTLTLGQPDGLLALAAAAAWRWRESWPGAVATAALIAAKLLAWPLLIWFLATRRIRQAGVAAGCAVALLVGSWACIGFKGIADYPRLLAADAEAFEARSHSTVSAFMRLGVSAQVAVPLAIVFAAVIGSAVVVCARGGDEGWFTAALLVGLLMSPVMWQHYLVLLFIPLAISRDMRDPLAWLLVAALWLSPTETPPTTWQALLVPMLASAIAIRAGVLARPGRLRSTLV